MRSNITAGDCYEKSYFFILLSGWFCSVMFAMDRFDEHASFLKQADMMYVKITKDYDRSSPVKLMHNGEEVGEGRFSRREDLPSHNNSSGIYNFFKKIVENEHVKSIALISCTQMSLQSFLRIGGICTHLYGATPTLLTNSYIYSWLLGGLSSLTIGTVWFKNKKDYLTLLFSSALAGAMGMVFPPQI